MSSDKPNVTERRGFLKVLGGLAGARGTGSWRTYHYARRNGNLYPCHGLGPVAQYMSLARMEDTFGRLSSFSSPSTMRTIYAKANFPPDHKWNQLTFTVQAAVRMATVKAIATFPAECISHGPMIEPDLIRTQPKKRITANTSGRSPHISGATRRIKQCGRKWITACAKFAHAIGSRRARLPAINPRNRISSVKPVCTAP
jgi:hypothetical protein